MKYLGSKTLETDRLILKAQTMEEQKYFYNSIILKLICIIILLVIIIIAIPKEPKTIEVIKEVEKR